MAILTLFAIITTDLQLIAQDALPRISQATRSDGLGYVVRFHFVQAPDSFKVFQPAADHIQIAIYTSQRIDPSRIELPQTGQVFKSYLVSPFIGGIGVDIRLSDSRNYLARAYMDANRRHLLVGLTEISAREISILTDGQPVIDWSRLNAAMSTDEVEATMQQSTVQDGDVISVDSLVPSPTPGIGTTSAGSTALPIDTSGIQGIDLEQSDISISSSVWQNRVNTSRRLRTIVIDAGHGGRDPGSIGPGGTREKNVALSVAKKLGAYINQHLPDVQVVYTREDDRFIELEERGRIANRARGDLFVSIHTNSARNRQAYGAEVFFLGTARTESALEVMKRENSVILLEDPATRSRELTEEELILYELNNIGNMSASQRLAEKIDRQFADRAQRRSRGIKQAGFIVLFHASMPAVLVELGFISNPTEERFLASDSGQNILASAIFRAIRDYKEQLEQH